MAKQADSVSFSKQELMDDVAGATACADLMRRNITGKEVITVPRELILSLTVRVAELATELLRLS